MFVLAEGPELFSNVVTFDEPLRAGVAVKPGAEMEAEMLVARCASGRGSIWSSMA